MLIAAGVDPRTVLDERDGALENKCLVERGLRQAGLLTLQRGELLSELPLLVARNVVGDDTVHGLIRPEQTLSLDLLYPLGESAVRLVRFRLKGSEIGGEPGFDKADGGGRPASLFPDPELYDRRFEPVRRNVRQVTTRPPAMATKAAEVGVAPAVAGRLGVNQAGFAALAVERPRQVVPVALWPLARKSVRVEDVLDLLKHIRRNEWRVRALVLHATPRDIA
ncbi:hypothetical protein MPY17_13845 [Rhodococcus opacus]|nr:hypothetical protein [Rhodococcus opacus]UOT06751.1 hypothetical protein MPY17_13845 [Rhodococcus opacus]